MSRALLVMLLALSSARSFLTGGDGYTYYEEVNKGYKLHKELMTWVDAVQTCMAEEARLSMPKNASDAIIHSYFFDKGTSIFIAFHDSFIDLNYMHVDGRNLDSYYDHWAEGEPNNIEGEEHCGSMRTGDGLIDRPCHDLLPFLCEKGPKEVYSRDPPRSFSHDTGYELYSPANMYYKLHREMRTFPVAMMECQFEGAELAFPRSESEAMFMDAAVELIPNQVILLGIHAAFIDDIYQDVNFQNVKLDGLKEYISYIETSQGECVVISRDLKVSLYDCGVAEAFVCQKSEKLLPTGCPAFDADYNFYPQVKLYYKFHKEPAVWQTATRICREEGSLLAVPSGDLEAKILLDLLLEHPEYSVPALTDSKNYLLLGFSDLVVEGVYVTEEGGSFATNYKGWNFKKHMHSEARDCGGLMRTGKITDVHCSVPAMFVCQKNFLPPARG